MKAESVMTSPVIALQPSMSVKQAGRVLVGHAISSAPVLDSDARLVGMLTEADILALQTAEDPRDQISRDDSADGHVPLTVAEIMSADVLAVSPDTDAGEIARLMLDRHLRCLPVVAADTVVGVVSRRDLLRALVRPDADIRTDLDSAAGQGVGDLRRLVGGGHRRGGQPDRPGGPFASSAGPHRGPHRARRPRGAGVLREGLSVSVAPAN